MLTLAELAAAYRQHGNPRTMRVRALLPDAKDWPDIAVHVDRLVFVLSDHGLCRLVASFMREQGEQPPADIDKISLRFMLRRHYPKQPRQWVEGSGGESLVFEPSRFNQNSEPSFFVHHPVTGELIEVGIDVLFEAHEIHVVLPQEMIDAIRSAWQQSRARAHAA